jgi:hypothetical protein
MDIRELKRQSELSYDTAVAKRNALEKVHSRQVMAYNGNLFRADPQTICLVRTLMATNSSFFILDTNENPVEIKDADDFLNRLIARNQEALNAYHQMYQTFTRKGD